MSRSIHFDIRTHLDPDAVASAFRAQLLARGAEAARYWINLRAADDEDREWGTRDFGFEPTVVGVVQPPSSEGDGALSRAALEIAHSSGSELLATHDGTPLFVYREGVVRLPPEDREFYEADVLPGFAGRVEWEELSLD